ncbi:MAG: putative Ig domain-containing protein [Cytophagales bacterium]|nr:putative Ig domain-containing protein [Armatimonadota bacterium]
MMLSLIGLSAPDAEAQQLASQAPPVPDYSARILTPPAPRAPRINGPNIYGQRPGSPFLYTIPVTGDRPITLSARGLPKGLTLDPQTGQITGRVADAGDFRVTLAAKNARGTGEKKFRIVIGEKIALTPPMGWNSWNSWAGRVNEDLVLRSAKALVSTGLINHGWSYVNIDDTWQGERTGPNQALLSNEKFPNMKGLCDQLHAMGLKAGIYSTPWITSYAHYPGGSSEAPDGKWTREVQGKDTYKRIGPHHFAEADARQWADWGFDYLKYDWDPNDVASTTEICEALRKSGRDIVLSLSNSAPLEKAADWARLSNAWRTTGDIVDIWGKAPSGWQRGYAEIGFGQDRWAPFAGPGHWNDPDMLVVGYVSLAQAMHYTRLSADEQYTHITLWSLLAAPLLIGCDLERLDPFTLSLLTNDEVIAVNQDALGRQAVRVSGPEFVPPPAPAKDQPLPAPSENPGGNALVYAKPLEDGSVAVGLFNVGPGETTVTVRFADLKLGGRRSVRDLWRQKDLGVFDGNYHVSVPSHGAALVRVQKP